MLTKSISIEDIEKTEDTKTENLSSVIYLKPAEQRRILFKKSRPTIRNITANDLPILWAAYKYKSFPNLPDMTQDEFRELVVMKFSPSFQEIQVIEDRNKSYANQWGPTALVSVRYDGWRLEPHVDWFAWATSKNILRGTVAYLQTSRHRKDVGVVVVRSLKHSKNLFDHAKKYGVVRFRGCIPDGDPRGDEYIYSHRGRREIKK